MAKKKATKEKEKKEPEMKQAKDQHHQVALLSKLGISNAQELSSLLEAALDSAGPVTIDVDAVEQVDTAGLQMLVSFINSALSKEIKVQWTGQSEVLISSAKTLGLHQYLEFEPESEEIAEDDLCPVF